MGTTSVESQIEILTQAIERALTVRAILATGALPDREPLWAYWDAALAACRLCGKLELALRARGAREQ